jgi:hypothetical protein
MDAALSLLLIQIEEPLKTEYLIPRNDSAPGPNSGRVAVCHPQDWGLRPESLRSRYAAGTGMCNNFRYGTS